MKIEKVNIKEFKVIENFEKEINGNHILIMGENGVGKSSLIQFIEIALGKTKNIPESATGEGEVFVTKDGREFSFKVKFKDNKPVVTVTSPDGLKDTRKGTIAGIVGANDFDIDEFVELSKSVAGRKKQVEIFKSFLPQDVITSLNNYEQHIKVSYDERTDAGRHLKEKEGYVKSHRLFNTIGVKKFEKKEIKSIIEKLQSLKEHNTKVLNTKGTYDANKLKLADLEDKIKKLQESFERGIEEQSKIESWLKENTVHEQSVIDSVEKELETVEQDNKDFTDSEQLKKEIDLIEKIKNEVGELTAKIDSSKQAISDTIKQMDSPIEGLSFEGDLLFYNGVPVNPDNLSTSEIIELGIKLKMAENKDLGILFIQRAESIGLERFKLIKNIADKEGWQIIAEQVERGNKKLHVEILSEDFN